MKERVEVFLAYLRGERQLSPNTIAAYGNDLHQFAAYLDNAATSAGGTGFALATIDRERLAGYFLHLSERGYTPASIARKIAAVRSFFQYLHRRGELMIDPSAGLGPPDVKKTLPRTADVQDVRALLAFCQTRETPEGTRDHAMLRLLAATGMRVSELVMLEVEDLDLADCRVRVVGRGKRERAVPLDQPTVDVLNAYIAHARPFLVRNTTGQTALIVNQRGQRLTRQGFWLIMKSLLREAGLSAGITPHTLRHSFATHLIGEGLGLEELRQLLGHASITTTQIYSQLADQPRGPTVPSVA
jgi:integrase/recombinase XerD